jgi:hypothetical protein
MFMTDLMRHIDVRWQLSLWRALMQRRTGFFLVDVRITLD